MSSMVLSSVLLLSINFGLSSQLDEQHDVKIRQRIEKLERQVSRLTQHLSRMEGIVDELQLRLRQKSNLPEKLEQGDDPEPKTTPSIRHYRLSGDATKSLITALDMLYGHGSVVQYSVDEAGNVLITIVGQ